MKKWVWFTLLAILLFAVLIRLMPLSNFPIWGSDTGEYFTLSNHLAEENSFQNNYNGWGFGYPYFPGMFIISAEVSLLTGLDLLPVILILTPVLAAFSSIIIFLITKRLGGSDKAGLIAAAFISVAMPHVFATSHAMPGTLGDLIALACLLLLLKSYDNQKHLPLLLLGSVALVVTHHLSTFLLLTAVITITLFRELLKLPAVEMKRLKIDLVFVFILLTMMIGFWFIYAGPFRDRVVLRGLGNIDLIYVVAAAYAGFAVFAALSYLARTKLKFSFKPKPHGARRQMMLFLVFLAATSVILMAVTTVKIPPMELTTDPILIVYLSPFIILFIFGILGPNAAVISREGIFLLAWMLSYLFTILASMITGSQEITLYRYTQYFVEPFAVAVGFGLAALVAAVYKLSDGKKDNGNGRSKVRKPWPVVIVISVLIVSAGLLAYPPKSGLGGFQEGITHGEMMGVVWCRDNIESGSTIATDHRLSSMLFGFAGLNASWDSMKKTFTETSFEAARSELNNSAVPSGHKRTDYVMLSKEMREGVALTQWEPASEMSEGAVAKFWKTPFYTIYDSGEVQVFVIDWGYDNEK